MFEGRCRFCGITQATLYGTSNAAALRRQQLEILYEGERQCISAVAFAGGGGEKDDIRAYPVALRTDGVDWGTEGSDTEWIELQ